METQQQTRPEKVGAKAATMSHVEVSSEIIRAKLETTKPSLNELLDIMTRVDEGLCELSEAETDLVGKLTREKVDNIKGFLDFVSTRAEALKAQANEFRLASKQLENLADRLKTNVAWNMKVQDFKKLSGYSYKIGLTERDKIEIKAEPNSQLFAQHPDLIKREYSWKKRDFDNAVKNGNEELKALCEITKTQSIRFTVNKGVN